MLEYVIIPLSVETIYGLSMSFLYITHAVIKKKMSTIWFSIVEPFVSSLFWWLHYESLPGHHGVVPPPVVNNLFALQHSAFRSGEKSKIVIHS